MANDDSVYVDPYTHTDILYDTLSGSDTTNQLSPSSPYKALMESIVDSHNAMQITVNSAMARQNALLASNMDELYTHISDRDDQGLYATPAKSKFTLRIPLSDFISSAILNDTTSIYKAIIPKNSYVQVDTLYFTLLYNLIIEYNKDTLIPYIAYDVDEDTLIYDGSDIGEVNILRDSNGVEWLIMNIDLPQLEVRMFQSMSISSIPYKSTMQYDNSYYSSVVEIYKDSMWQTIDKTYVNNLYDINTPTIYTKVSDGEVYYELPQNFIDNGYAGKIRTTIYSTIGKININMSTFLSDDFTFVINRNVTSDEEASSFNMMIKASHTGIVNGGTLPLTFDNIKARIINKVTGKQETPITEKQVNEVIRQEGMVGEIVQDTLFDRIFLAKQETWLSKTDNAYTTTFMNKVTIDDLTDRQDTIYISEKYIEIKPNTIFANVNGIARPITKTEATSLNLLTPRNLIKKLNSSDTEYFVNMFTYIINNDDTTTEASVYNELDPEFKSLYVKDKNTHTTLMCDLYDNEVTRNGNVLNITFKLTGNTLFSEVEDKSYIKAQLKIPTENGFLYHYSTYDSTTKEYSFDIDISPFVIEDKLTVISGTASNLDKTIDISPNMSLLIYVDNTTIYNENSSSSIAFAIDEVPNINIVGISRYNGSLTILEEYKYIWKNSLVHQLTKSYKRYTDDIPLVYSTDVYEINPDNDTTYFIRDVVIDGVIKKETYRNKLFAIGDPVLDTLGNQIMQHNIGDLILLDNEPIETNEITYTVETNMLMINLAFQKSLNPTIKENLKELKLLLNNVLLEKLDDLNDHVVDNTVILFKPKNTLGYVETLDGNIFSSLVKPVVTLYYPKDTEYTVDNVSQNIIIGNIIKQYITKKFFSIRSIEQAIVNELSYVEAVDVNGIGSGSKGTFSLTTENVFYMGVTVLDSGTINYNLQIHEQFI